MSTWLTVDIIKFVIEVLKAILAMDVVQAGMLFIVVVFIPSVIINNVIDTLMDRIKGVDNTKERR